MKRHQVIRHQSAADHSVIVLDEPGWMKSPRYISNVVKCLEEIRQEGFTHVLKNLEAQMVCLPLPLLLFFMICLCAMND